MTTTKAIIVLRISADTKFRLLNKERKKIELACKKEGFEIIKTYKYKAGNHVMRKAFKTLVDTQPERVAVIVNDLCFDEKDHKNENCLLNELTRRGAICVYKVNTLGNLFINRGIV